MKYCEVCGVPIQPPQRKHCGRVCRDTNERRLRLARKRQVKELIAAAAAAGDSAKATRLKNQLWTM